jgi:hypothetical protein
MATPPYSFDTGNPTTSTQLPNFPANEMAFRATVAGALGGIFDPTTGYAFLQGGTTTQKNAVVNPPTYMLFYDITLGHIYVNTGTPASPTWTQA